MSTLPEVLLGIVRFAAEQNCWVLPSGVYDLFPNLPHSATVDVSHDWPAPWPNGRLHGVYLFFGDTPGHPEFLYVGKSSGRNSCIRTRLNGYVDLDEYRTTGACVLRQEWHGYLRPWGAQPRYAVTIGLESDADTETCPRALLLESFLIRHLVPTENVKQPRS